MTLWLAAVIAAAAVVVSRPRAARRRLADFPAPSRRTEGSPLPLRGSAVVVGSMVGSALVALRVPIPLAGAAGLVPVAVVIVRQRRADARLRAAREAAVVEVTFALAAELRAGRTSKEALLAAADTAGPLRSVLRAAASAVELGGSAAGELEAATDLPGAERLRSVAATWRVAEGAGGRVALVLEHLGEAMDRDDQVRRELQAALAAPRATMVLLAGLPVVGLGLGQAIGANPLHLLVYRPIGWALLAGAAVLDAMGVAASRLITRWALR